MSFKILLLAPDADPSWPEKIRRAVPGVVVNTYSDPQDALDDIADADAESLFRDRVQSVRSPVLPPSVPGNRLVPLARYWRRRGWVDLRPSGYGTPRARSAR